MARRASIGDDLMVGRAQRALDDLHSLGWAVGPTIGSDVWRREVVALSRQEGLRVRTGEASPPGDEHDSSPRPWVATVEGYESLRRGLGGLSLSDLGAILVSAADRGDPHRD